ncbi:hypothetical protein WNZ14_01580 [Hoeflea sp. AS60]|uniref:hypothetical protein n=1 Tax=Hoeflea sp. AS60 TaxID=3135780 RepID=UPI00317754B7
MSDAYKDPAPYERRQVVAHFHDAIAFERAVALLEENGIPRDAINMVATHDTVIAKLAHRYEARTSPDNAAAFPQAIYLDRHEVEGDEKLAIGAPIYIGGAGAGLAVVATGGTLALAIAAGAAAAAAGAGIGVILSKYIERHRAEFLAKHLALGDLLVTVDVQRDADEAKALDLMVLAGGGNVHSQSFTGYWDNDEEALGNFDLNAYREWG